MLTIHYFSPASSIKNPKQFPSPFNRTPHPLALQAFQHSQKKILPNLLKNKDNSFMLHFLVVMDKQHKIGYLLAPENALLMHQAPALFSPKEMEIVLAQYEQDHTQISQKKESLIQQGDYKKALQQYQQLTLLMQHHLSELTSQHQLKRQKRHQERKKLALNRLDPSLFIKQRLLNNESQQDKLQRKKQKKQWEQKLLPINNIIEHYNAQIADLNEQLKQLEKQTDKDKIKCHRLYQSSKHYTTLDTWNDKIREATNDNTTIQLLSYANQQDYALITIASFWWGRMPKDEIRHHQFYYPAKKSTCGALIPYLLANYSLEATPIPGLKSKQLKLVVLFEDDDLLVVDKPSGLLSVPGKVINDSVYSRIKIQYPSASGPLLVHRLDMSTSGILLIAKKKSIHKALQQQFTARQVKKHYIALLSTPKHAIADCGLIDFPLRVDFDDRPRQKICTIYGKSAQTNWQVIGKEGAITRVKFSPITGRTHQLRMHAAHYLGLNAPIIGDVLYHQPSKRLMLHATDLVFIHPSTQKNITIHSKCPF